VLSHARDQKHSLKKIDTFPNLNCALQYSLN
jgi:hypothetical protein